MQRGLNEGRSRLQPANLFCGVCICCSKARYKSYHTTSVCNAELSIHVFPSIPSLTGAKNDINAWAHRMLPNTPCKLQHQRSEEHTSELQSQSNLVCRLLLEKKKNIPHSQQKT